MQRTKTKILSVFLSFCMIVSCMAGISVTAYADTNYETIEITDKIQSATSTSELVEQMSGFTEITLMAAMKWEPPAKSGVERLIYKIDGEYFLYCVYNDGTYKNNSNQQLSGLKKVTNVKFYYLRQDNVAVTGVTLNPTTATLTVGGTETLTATVAPNNATVKSVTWSSDNESIATVADGVVTAVGSGTANITVTTTDGSFTATCVVTVNKGDPTVPTDLTATYGQKLSDVALTTGWTWADSTQSVGDVGEHTFKANFAGDSNYNAASNVDVTVTVEKADNPATVTGTATVTKGGNTVDLATNVTKNGATGDVTYAISGEANGCSLNGSVLTSGNDTGSVTVNVSVAEDSNYNALAATPITVTISDKTAQTITASDVTATYGDTGKSVSATTDGDGTISYSIKSGDAVTVDATTGALTIVKAGSAVITVTAAETDNYAAATKDITVTVNKKDPTTPTGLTAKTGQTLADVKLPTGWAWADAGTTSVGEVGDNKFKANYTPTDATNYNSKTNVELTVKVSAAFVPVTAIELNYSTYSMKVGESNALSTSFTPADATNLSLTYTSSNTSVVTISDIGLFTAVGLGTATLTVTATNGTADTSDDVTATCVVTVTAASGGGGYTPVIPSGGTTTTTTTTTNTGSFADKTEENNNYAGAEINMKTEDLEKAVLTDEDKKVIAAGGNVTVELEVEEKTPTAEEKKEVEAAVEAAKEASGEDYTVAMYFDANLFKTSNGTKTQLHETNGKIAVSFKLPAQFKNTDSSVTRTYAVARIHDGKTEILVCEYDPETDLLTFYTDKFSTYALMYEDAKADDADVSAVDDDDEQGDEGVVDDEQFDETDDDFDELTDDEGDFDDDFAEDQTDSDTDNDVQAAVDAVVDSGETNPHTNAPLAGMGVFAVMSFFAAAAAYTAKKRKNK